MLVTDGQRICDMASRPRELDRGTTFTIGVQYPRTLAGATIQFTIKTVESDQVADDTTALVKKDVTSHADEVNGVSSIVLTPSDTALITPGTYYYSIHVLEASGDRYKIDEGRIKIDGAPGNRIT